MGPSDWLHLPALPDGRPGWTPETRAAIERISYIDEAIRQEALSRLPPTTREVLIDMLKEEVACDRSSDGSPNAIASASAD
jgi:hypothetical protein